MQMLLRVKCSCEAFDIELLFPPRLQQMTLWCTWGHFCWFGRQDFITLQQTEGRDPREELWYEWELGAIASRGCGGSKMVGEYHLLSEVLLFLSPYVELVVVGETKLRVKRTIDGCRATRGQHTQDIWTFSCHLKIVEAFWRFFFGKVWLEFLYLILDLWKVLGNFGEKPESLVSVDAPTLPLCCQTHQPEWLHTHNPKIINALTAATSACL